MQYCLDIKSSYKFGLESDDTKYIIKKAYENEISSYILNKPKTGWSAPIMSWLNTENILKTKFENDIRKDDGIKSALHDLNYIDDDTIGEDLSGKRKIVSWMFRSWAQEFNMYL